jgi:hypothetical protein
LNAQNSIEEEIDAMATAPKRQVHVSTVTHEAVAHDQPQTDITSILQDEARRLQSELRRTQDANREISDRNKQLAASKKIADSVVAPKPFLGAQKNKTLLIG